MERTHVLRRETWLAVPIDRAFRFFCDPANLERITPPELRFRLLTQSTDGIGLGTEFTYRLQLFGVPFGWRSRISDWSPDAAFTDIALQSPYRLWSHRHELFMEKGGTRMVDHVDYELPLWPLGELAHFLVRRELERIFDFREATIQEIFAPGAGPRREGLR